MDLEIPILFSDPHFIVINKPAGVIVNNADTARGEFTIQDFIDKKFNISDNGSEFSSRGGIVHRLDKETSGALIVALNEESFVNIQAQFKKRQVHKEYLALCHGRLVEEGEINVPIGRLPWNRMRFGVIPQGREAYTKFKVEEYRSLKTGKTVEPLSLVKVFPQTGRTHQIRVHFQYVGHPIFADNLYAGRKTIARDRKLLNRHFLHASKISFIHPLTKKPLTVDAPLTAELVDFLARLP